MCTTLPIKILRTSNEALAKDATQNPKDDLTSHTFLSLPSGDTDGPNGMFYIYQCFSHDSRTSEPGSHRVYVYICPRRKNFSLKAIERHLIRMNILCMYTKLNSYTLEIRGKNKQIVASHKMKRQKLVPAENEYNN